MTPGRVPATSDLSRDDAGFVIVGVVMFVLALTILGLSLFSLSSYESQFIGGSLSGEQAFNQSMTGVEQVKYRLVASGQLDAAVGVVGTEGVTFARAYQQNGANLDSSGPVTSSVPVKIRVIAGAGNNARMIQGEFDMGGTQDFYRRLITSSDGVTVDTVMNGTPRLQSVVLTGRVWQNSPDTTWTQSAFPTPSSLRPIKIGSPSVPIPAVSAFLSGAPPATNIIEVPGDSATNDAYRLDLGPSNTVTYYRWAGAGSGDYDFVHGSTFIVRVRGYAIWLLGDGIGTFGRMVVDGTSADALIIIAGKAGPDGLTGINFTNGIDSGNVPVVLVSDGKVILNSFNNGSGTYGSSYLSIFANGVTLVGPETGIFKRILNHDLNSPLDQSSGLIRMLLDNGHLPNPTAAANSITLRPGTWTQSSN